MIEQHPLFRQPVDQTVKVWRYINLAKFVRLLQTRSLFFARADRLGDPFEGSNTHAWANYWQWACAPGNETELGRVYPTMSADQARGVVEGMRVERQKQLKRVFVSCWHASNVESAAMWSLYGEISASIAVCCSYSALALALPPAVYMGEVQYLDWDREGFDQGNMLAPFVSKRSSYRHEQEVRAVIDALTWEAHYNSPLVSDDFGSALQVDVNAVVHEIFVSPTAPTWFEEVVIGLARNYGLIAPIHRSALGRDPVY